jgi:hypothetical protein
MNFPTNIKAFYVKYIFSYAHGLKIFKWTSENKRLLHAGPNNIFGPNEYGGIQERTQGISFRTLTFFV